MSTHTTSTVTTIDRPHRAVPTRRLLACGIVAGPLFAVVATAQVLTREGYDLARHPISLLSLGDAGWVQIANFVVTGGLLVAFAVGMRRTLHGGRGGTWGPRLVGAFGACLVAAGVFVTDPSDGFPVGAPQGLSGELSWHGLLHGLGPLGFDFLIVGCLVLARRFAAERRRSWTAASIATAVALLALLANPVAPGLSIRMAAGAAVAFAYTTLLAVRLSRRS